MLAAEMGNDLQNLHLARTALVGTRIATWTVHRTQLETQTMKNSTPLNPRHLRLPLKFAHRTFLACKDPDKRAYWKRVLHAKILEAARAHVAHWQENPVHETWTRTAIRQTMAELLRQLPDFADAVHRICEEEEDRLNRLAVAAWRNDLALGGRWCS